MTTVNAGPRQAAPPTGGIIGLPSRSSASIIRFMDRIIGTSAPAGPLDFHNSDEQRPAMADCYNKSRQPLLHRILASHAGMRRYYGGLRVVAVWSLLALAFVVASHGGASAQSKPAQTAPDRPIPDQAAPDQSAQDQSAQDQSAQDQLAQDGSSHDWAGEKGAASFYGKAHQGRRTASGNRFDDRAMTAAHPWLPFGTKVLVTVEGTGRAVIVTITDRLPSKRRIIDLSREAAMKLGIIRQGIAYVSLSPG